MPYCPENLKTEAFIAGQRTLYAVLQTNPQLRMVSIDHLESVRSGLKQLGYNVHIRYRGPKGPRQDTIKKNARAFTAYIRG